MTPGDSRRPPGTRPRLTIDFGRRGVARDVDRELSAHIQLKEDELMAAGMSPEEAAREARRAFGDRDHVADECVAERSARQRRVQRSEWWSAIAQDLRIAMRSLRRAPAFTTVAILTLALGIGANTAIFSIIDAIVLRGLPYREPATLAAPQLAPDLSVSKSRLALLRERQRAFSGLSAYTRAGYTLTGQGDAEQLQGAQVTAEFFDVLGVTPGLGRAFVPGEDAPGRNDVVVLGHGLWQQRFGGDSSILGRTLQLNGRAHTVIGVAPPSFAFPVATARLYTPLSLNPADTSDYVAGYLLMAARLRPGMTIGGAESDLRRIVTELAADQLGGFEAREASVARVSPLADVLVGPIGRALVLLWAAVGFILLIACANVANLLLARASAREREFAVRTSLGAGRGRLVRQLLTESVLLGVLGGVVGVLLAYLLVELVAVRIPSNAPGVAAIDVNGRVLLFTTALSTVVGVLFGLAPAMRLARSDPADALRDGGRSGSPSAQRHRLMRGLVVSEVALALVLAIGAGLVLTSFRHLRNESTGFRSDGVLSFMLTVDGIGDGSEAATITWFTTLFERLASIPGVQHVGGIHLIPLFGGNWNPSMVIEDRPLPQGATAREVDWRLVTPDYFATLEIPLVGGRLFDDRDVFGAPSVVLVNQSLASKYFPGEDPIGRRVRTFFEGRGNWATIVGVVADTKDQSVAGDTRPQIYRNFWQRPQPWLGILVRTSGSPAHIVPSVRAVVRDQDADAVMAEVQSLDAVVAKSISQPRLLALLLGLFGVLAVGLGMIGIYGVMSYLVALRMPEMGVRVAMGARPGDIRRLVLRDALRLTAIGLLLGGVIAFWVTRVLSTQLHDISARDPGVFVATTLLLALVAVAASWIPAARASRSEPSRLMRQG